MIKRFIKALSWFSKRRYLYPDTFINRLDNFLDDIHRPRCRICEWNCRNGFCYKNPGYNPYKNPNKYWCGDYVYYKHIKRRKDK